MKQCFRLALGTQDDCISTFNTIAISRRDAQSAFVGIDIAGDNGHGCAYYATARVVDGEIIATARGRRTGGLCKVQIQVSDSGVASFKALEPYAACALNFCSARGDMYQGGGFVRHARAANNKLQRTSGAASER